VAQTIDEAEGLIEKDMGGYVQQGFTRLDFLAQSSLPISVLKEVLHSVSKTHKNKTVNSTAKNIRYVLSL